MNLNSKITKALAIVILLLAGMMAYAASTGQLTTLPQNILGAIAVPFQQLTTAVGNKFDAWTDRNLNIDEIIRENERLKEELHEMRLNQIDYDKLALENKEYKELLDIVDDISAYDTVSASVIGRDGMDRFYSFTIDKGTKHDIEINDVVISADGVVGVIVETGSNFSKVATILSPAVNMGCFAGSERDTGIVSGSYDLSEEQMCTMYHLPKETKVGKGDLVSTTGYGTVFPKDLIVGTVESVEIDRAGNSNTASVMPAADIKNVKFVFVITDFT
ncbi:MAG: rod shape-determining protein MreC [Oscillospiraceae bacterium]|nr:rod shape-determining protein MreC [Oscillospiraceae bacterium]